MGFSVISQNKNHFVILLFLSFFLTAEMRPLRDQQWQDGLLFQSLPKNGGGNTGSNPCSNIPGGTGHCSKKIAGHIVRAPPAFPKLIMDVAVASSIASETNQDPTS
ncbi:hypothetical protein P3X46_003059 [Hevea brasiliensis]|uniref:Uncharacterized protein n=1 Tax=Hevea brasiliensis TaxID=3981 RepID=A0ABQ9N8S9_HEVBR|nr:hypothetical protein P3X46_003059 [Hevea brasiliensis]